ncbi:UNVERIFIED_CONTAM: hypothetical protein Slati_4231200 [Sesamum latifolium]|uniref:Reverse transcriptase n=1 Tax=Sesamum latifolium TaxID=2727402 RepID=A0AAW2TB39_9LAMI
MLRRLAQVSVRPWLVVGDFNEILSQQEKQGILQRVQWKINGFRDYFHECDLHDIGFEGNIFTWSNHREAPHTVRVHLDPACSSPRWASLFPCAKDSMNELASREEVIWKQRDKVLWLTEGDRNTRFFDAKDNERRQTKEIKKIQDSLG